MQPRERSVPCLGCRRPTWQVNAMCPSCEPSKVRECDACPSSEGPKEVTYTYVGEEDLWLCAEHGGASVDVGRACLMAPTSRGTPGPVAMCEPCTFGEHFDCDRPIATSGPHPSDGLCSVTECCDGHVHAEPDDLPEQREPWPGYNQETAAVKDWWGNDKAEVRCPTCRLYVPREEWEGHEC